MIVVGGEALFDLIAAGDDSSWHDRRPALGDLDAAVQATRFACRVAAATCERAGAFPPRREEL